MNKKMKYISCFMLGITRIFIIIRSQIKNTYNVSILGEVCKYCLMLKYSGAIEFDKFRDTIIKIVKNDAEMCEYLENALKMNNIDVVTDNESEIFRYLPVISDSALEICNLLRDKKFDNAYDLIDAIHCLPEAIINKSQWSPKEFWEIYIHPYREKWDNNFLSRKELELI